MKSIVEELYINDVIGGSILIPMEDADTNKKDDKEIIEVEMLEVLVDEVKPKKDSEEHTEPPILESTEEKHLTYERLGDEGLHKYTEDEIIIEYIYSEEDAEKVELYEKTLAQQFEEIHGRKPIRKKRVDYDSDAGLPKDEERDVEPDHTCLSKGTIEDLTQEKDTPQVQEECVPQIKVEKAEIKRIKRKAKKKHGLLGPKQPLDDSLEIMSYLKKGRKCIEKGKYKLARKYAEKALGIDPDGSLYQISHLHDLANDMLKGIDYKQGIQRDNGVNHINLEKTIESTYEQKKKKAPLRKRVYETAVSIIKTPGTYLKKGISHILGYIKGEGHTGD